MDARVVAYHEAGHAVMAWDQGLAQHRATIIASKGSAGYVEHSWGVSPLFLETGYGQRLRTAVERNVRVGLAGELAQRRFEPKSIQRFHAAADRATANDLLIALHGHDNALLAAHWKLLELETDAILRRFWRCVESVAALLVEQGTASGKAVREVIYTANRVPAYAPRRSTP